MSTIRVPIYRKRQIVAYATVDSSDRWVLAHRWCFQGKGYAAARIDGVRTYLHRAVMGCIPGDGVLVDHKSGVRLDCRRANLRLGDQPRNQANRRGPRNGARIDSANPRGVAFDRRRGTYSARVTVHGITYSAHGFNSVRAASAAAKRLRRQYMAWSPEESA